MPRTDGSSTQPAERFTLEECIGIALNNQPAIGAQRSAMCAAAEQQRIAHSFFLPQLSFNARYTHLDDPLSVDIPSPFAGRVGDVFSDAAAYFGIARQAGSAAANAALDNPNAFPFSIAKQAALNALPDNIRVGLLGENSLATEFLLSQPLWTGGKITYRDEQAELGVRAAKADVAKSEQQTAFDVTQAYLGMQLAYALTGVTEDVEGQFRAIERLVKNMVEQNHRYVTMIDVHRVRAFRAMAESERIAAAQGAKVAYAALRQQMGLHAAVDFGIADTKLQPWTTELQLPALLDAALARRPEMAKVRLAVQIADLERKLAQAGYSPDLALFGRFSTINDDGGFANPNDRYQWAAGVTLGVPVYTGGRRTAQAREAESRQAQARQMRQLARDLITLEVQKAYLEYLEKTERLPIVSEAVQETSATIEGYRHKDLGGGVAPKDKPKYYEDLSQAWILHALAQSRYYGLVFECNRLLAKIKLITASDVYQDLVVERPGGDAPALDPAGMAVARSGANAAAGPAVFERAGRGQ